jgi:hypothetical protein
MVLFFMIEILLGLLPRDELMTLQTVAGLLAVSFSLSADEFIEGEQNGEKCTNSFLRRATRSTPWAAIYSTPSNV